MNIKQILYALITVGFCATVQISVAQNVKLTIHSIDDATNILYKDFSLKQNFSDTISCEKYITQLPSLLQSKGYISAALDSIIKQNNHYTVYVFVGEKYIWKELKIKEQDKLILSAASIKQNIFYQKPFNPEVVKQVQEKLLDYFEIIGYPFASIGFDSLVIENKEVSAQLLINKGILYKMDSIKIIGNAKISKNFLYKYLSMPMGGIYNIEKLQSVEKKLTALPYITQTQPLQLTMLGSSFITNVFLNNKKSNQVDAIIGLMPENPQTGGSLLLTVDAKLKLQNAFATGETIGLIWQQIQPKSPRLNIQFQRPYIFNTQFGVDAYFDLFKKDSSFLNIQAAVGINYMPSTQQNVKLFFQSYRTNLLEVDTSTIKFTKQLPDVVDVSVNSIAAEYNFNNTNYTFNPRSGNDINVKTSVGTRTIRKNNTISQIKDPNFNYNSLYDSVQIHTYQLNVQIKAAHYFPLGKYATLKTALQSGIINSPSIFRNEMFRIGGIKLLRGFDEESIFTDKYIVGTTEFRYLYGQNAYFCGFTDIGYTYNTITQKKYYYVGIGTGISFETKQGIFNIMIAAGKRNDLPLSLRQSKIHIGFVSLF
ncbi:MAG: hypothetical protein KF781_06595 [Chitinophagaceae bacterium]|nr:hypothetical protein [Chitinophagaceae bacterium]MCW5904111.1 hypothetical protein [Chitinophagaceae bacterium]